MKKTTAILILLLHVFAIHAHEGMWMLNNLKAPLVKQMQALGLQLNQNQLYNPYGASLKDAVVSFGGFCTGVVVSPDGLVFTNHHCGFERIQQHSSTENDYLKEGFIAKTREEELPNPGLFVSFLLRTIDVSSRVLSAVPAGASEEQREEIVDSVCTVIQNEAIQGDSSLNAVVSPYYQGNEYYLSVYRDYKDVRLVFAPPSSVGKFGGDTDNWEWPRHTGDFSIFRIYANANNEPAEFDEANVPYHPSTYAPVSLQGYQEGTFSMTVGYPGQTIRYLSSYGIEERMTGMNESMIQVRGLKQDIWRKAMDANTNIRIMYDSKYAESSNYWKNSIGMNESIAKLGILEQKHKTEKELAEWIAKDARRKEKYSGIVEKLAKAYAERSQVNKPFYFMYESFVNASDVLRNAALLLRTDFSEDNPDAVQTLSDLLDSYKDIDIDLDKEVFVAMLKFYRDTFSSEEFLPDFYSIIDNAYDGNYQAYADSVYNQSMLVSREKLVDMIQSDDMQAANEDPIIYIMIDVFVKIQELQHQVYASTLAIDENERLLNAALREMDQSQAYYSDANSTMRMSFGTVQSYTMNNGKNSGIYCGPDGLLNKAETASTNKDYELLPSIKTLMEKADFGRYRDSKSKDLQLCFLTNNDITGGNSGSPVFNGKGELIGLAFDGNWEAMSSDIAFNTQLQRCISVDIRYVLFMMDKWGDAQHLLTELTVR